MKGVQYFFEKPLLPEKLKELAKVLGNIGDVDWLTGKDKKDN
jgi:hypothetical protein